MNKNPKIKEIQIQKKEIKFNDGTLVDVNSNTVFELIRNIKDPEHPQTLEQLDVVSLDLINVYEDIVDGNQLCNKGSPVKNVKVYFRPTIPHCSMASLIGLAIKIQLLKHISCEYCITVLVSSNGHVQEKDLNKQLNDKDRVFAAMESENVMALINELIPVIN